MRDICYVRPPELNYSPTPSLAHLRAVKRRPAQVTSRAFAGGRLPPVPPGRGAV
jgi:hypothetical protein